MQKKVKNGFIEVKETMKEGVFHNPSTHDDDRVMRKAWVFTPMMLPDDAEMPRNPEAWDAEFKRIGERLQSETATNQAEFDEIIKRCTRAIEKSYDRKHGKPDDSGTVALQALGFK